MATKKELKQKVKRQEELISNLKDDVMRTRRFARSSAESARTREAELLNVIKTLQDEIIGNAQDLLEVANNPRGLSYTDAFDMEVSSHGA